MINFNIDDHNIVANLGNLNNTVRNNLKNKITELSIKLTNNIKSAKLTGTVLKVRTGRLRNSIQYRVADNGNEIKGTVSTNVVYAPIHEYGFNGSITVKSHMRTIKEAFGRSINPKQILVNSFSRNVNMPERSFMRSALDDMRGQITSELEQVVNNVNI